MTAAANSWRHRLGDVLLILGAGYLALGSLGGLTLFPYDLFVAVAALGLAMLIGDYRTRWWPVARYTDRKHELNIRPGERSPK